MHIEKITNDLIYTVLFSDLFNALFRCDEPDVTQ